MNISPKDVSFVVHGPVDPAFTRNCINSIRRHFGYDPEVVVSTWPDAPMDFIYDYNIAVYNNDPGPNIYGEAGVKNLNRHIVSTLNGCLQATRKYICKVRSDVLFVNANILRWHNVWDKYHPQYKLYQERVSATNLYTLYPDDRPMYISDFVFFGRRHDIIKMFSLPFMGKSNYGPEQYIAATPFQIKYNLDEPAINRLSKHLIGNNYQILDGQRQFGIMCQKYPHYRDNWHESMMKHIDWLMLYYDTIYGRLGV